MNANPRLNAWLLLPGLVMAAVAVAVALEGPDGARLLHASLNALGVALVWTVGLLVHQRYPTKRIGVWLFVLAGAHAIQSLAASTDPLLFTLARVTRPAVEVLLFSVVLIFPSGRLTQAAERAVLAVALAALLLLWLPAVMMTPRIPMPGAFVVCQDACPRNVLQVVDEPGWAEALFTAFRVVTALSYAFAVALLLRRFQRASALARRTLLPLVLAAVARGANVAIFVATGALALGLVFTFWGVPLAILVGYMIERGRVARALAQLVVGLRTRPTEPHMRELMANALDDRSLALAIRLQDPERWVDAHGAAVQLPALGGADTRAVTLVSTGDGHTAAALIHDSALRDEPALLEAVVATTQLMLESQHIDAEMRASQASAVAHERDRIERDLHDGAQQRLIALRIKLSVAARLIDADPRRASELVRELDLEVATAIAELRAFARGVFPPLLVERGLSEALGDATRRAALPVEQHIAEVGRFDAGVESAVYFCCLEALQNVAKHAGAHATARVGLVLEGDALCFWVEDNGVGFAHTRQVTGGRGLANLHARMAAVNGQVTIGSAAGGGVSVRGRVPLAAQARTAQGGPPAAPIDTAARLVTVGGQRLRPGESGG